MLDLLKEMFSYPFMVRAILVGTIVALCSSLLGVSLVLKRYSMIGDWLSGTLEEGFSKALVSGSADSIFKEGSWLFESRGATLNSVLPPLLPQADRSMQITKAGTMLFHILRMSNYSFHALYDPIEEEDNDVA